MRAVLFDLDGTLTDCKLDYVAIRRELGLHAGPILEQVDLRGTEVAAVLDRHERRAATDSVLAAGAREIIDWLTDRGVPVGVVTRNSRSAATATLAKHGLEVNVLVTREDRPHKPDPFPVQLAAKRLGVDAASCWMVGDGENDVAAGNAAGCRTVWLSFDKPRRFAASPDHGVRDLPALLAWWQTPAAGGGLTVEVCP